MNTPSETIQASQPLSIAPVTEIYLSEVNGLLAPFGDTEAFVAQANGLIGDMARVRRIGAAARQSVEPLAW